MARSGQRKYRLVRVAAKMWSHAKEKEREVVSDGPRGAERQTEQTKREWRGDRKRGRRERPPRRLREPRGWRRQDGGQRTAMNQQPHTATTMCKNWASQVFTTVARRQQSKVAAGSGLYISGAMARLLFLLHLSSVYITVLINASDTKTTNKGLTGNDNSDISIYNNGKMPIIAFQRASMTFK